MMDKDILKRKLATKKILVVDDEPAVCNMLEKFLTKKEYKVSTALSGKEAIKKVKREKPHIIFLDIRMPHMDGIEVLKRIREIVRWSFTLQESLNPLKRYLNPFSWFRIIFSYFSLQTSTQNLLVLQEVLVFLSDSPFWYR